MAGEENFQCIQTYEGPGGSLEEVCYETRYGHQLITQYNDAKDGEVQRYGSPLGANASATLPEITGAFSWKDWYKILAMLHGYVEAGANYSVPIAVEFYFDEELYPLFSIPAYYEPYAPAPPMDNPGWLPLFEETKRQPWYMNQRLVAAVHGCLYAGQPELIAQEPPTMWSRKWLTDAVAVCKAGWAWQHYYTWYTGHYG